MPFDPNEPRDDRGRWSSFDATNAIKAAANEKPKYDFTGKLSVDKIKKIKPEEFYKYEYFSKQHNAWLPVLATDNPYSLHKSGYEIRTKEIHRYTP